MKTDGWITIGTKLSTKDLEIDLNNLKKSLQEAESENKILLKAQADNEQALRDIEVGKQYYEEMLQSQLAMLDTEEERNAYMQEYSGMLELMNAGYEKAKLDVEETNNRLEKNAQVQEEIRAKIAQQTKEMERQKSISGLTGNISKNLDGVLTKVARWGLMLIGIHGAYSLISRSMSTLSQQDENVKNQLEYIRWTVANALAPVVKYILNLIYTILNLINNITSALFGFKLFKGPEEFAKSMKKASGSAKDIQKTLAGFDEMNILGKNTAAAGGGGASSNLPEFDLLKDFSDWINKHKGLILDALTAITAALIGMKLLGLDPIQAMGLGVAVLGLIKSIKNIIKFLKDPTFDNFIEVLESIGLLVVGIGLLFGAWPVAIAGALAIVVAEVVKHRDTIREKFQELINWVETDFSKQMTDSFGAIGAIIAVWGSAVVSYLYGIFSRWSLGVEDIITGIVKMFQGDFFGGISLVFTGLAEMLTSPFYGMLEAINAVIRGINKLISKVNELTGSKLKPLKEIATNYDSKKSTTHGGGVTSGGGKHDLGSSLTAIAGAGVGLGNYASNASNSGVNFSDLYNAIGNIQIDLTNVTTLDGNTISRYINQINANNDFLRNR